MKSCQVILVCFWKMAVECDVLCFVESFAGQGRDRGEEPRKIQGGQLDGWMPDGVGRGRVCKQRLRKTNAQLN